MITQSIIKRDLTTNCPKCDSVFITTFSNTLDNKDNHSCQNCQYRWQVSKLTGKVERG